MQAVKNLLRASPLVTKTIVPQRAMSVISTPPRNKVSKVELTVLASIMVIGWTIVPAWVLANIKHYRSGSD